MPDFSRASFGTALPAFVALSALSALAVPATGRADAIEPPRTDCVEGSEGDSCHGGPYCRARGCTGPSDCRIGERCAARDLCALTFDCFWDTVPAVDGACGSAGCAAGSTCTSLFVCVTAPPTPDAGRLDAGSRPDAPATGTDAPGPRTDAGPIARYHTTYCGCAVPARAAPPTWIALAIGATGLALGARRRACRRAARAAKLRECTDD